MLPGMSDTPPYIEIADLGTFEHAVFKAERPVVVDYWAAWCGPCQAMAPIFASLATRYGHAVTFAKVDTENAPEVARAAGIRSLPTFGFYWKGELRDVLVGAQSANALASRIEKLIARAEGRGLLDRLFRRS